MSEDRAGLEQRSASCTAVQTDRDHGRGSGLFITAPTEA